MGKRILQGVGAGLFLLLVLAALASRLGLVAVSFPRPEGHFFWSFSRALGITAYLGVTLELAMGLLMSTKVGDAWLPRARSVEVHEWLSAVSMGLILAHAVVLMGDRYVRFDVLDVLVPFASGYARVAVGLGVLGAYMGAAVHLSFAMRKRLGARVWRRLHYVSFPMFWLVTAHALLAGTDSGSMVMRVLYSVCAGIVLWLSFYRALFAIAQRLSSAARAHK